VRGDFSLFKKMKQRGCIKFCVKNKIKCSDVVKMLTVAFGESTLSERNIYKWYKQFEEGREDRSNVKVLLTVFFDYDGVVHHEFLPEGTTVNKEYYLQVMRRLREAIRRKRPDLWKNNSWLLHHDNAPAHTSLLVRNFLAKNNTIIMPQPPYSPDLLKTPSKGRGFPRLSR